MLELERRIRVLEGDVSKLTKRIDELESTIMGMKLFGAPMNVKEVEKIVMKVLEKTATK